MNGKMIPIAVAALAAVTSPSLPAAAPPPSTAAVAAFQVSRPPAPRVLTVAAAQLTCLALNVYWEARGELLAGQAAVAHVTLNRVGSPDFPNSICGVVMQTGADGSCQFGWWCSSRRTPADPAAWQRSQEVARRALAGSPDPTGGALYFHHVNERPSFAIGRYAGDVRIGDHLFFRLAGKATSSQMVRH